MKHIHLNRRFFSGIDPVKDVRFGHNPFVMVQEKLVTLQFIRDLGLARGQVTVAEVEECNVSVR